MSLLYSKLGIPVTFYDHFDKALSEGKTINISVVPKIRKGVTLDYRLFTVADGAKKEVDDLDMLTFRELIRLNPERFPTKKIEHNYFNEALKHAEEIKSNYHELTGKDVHVTINGKALDEIKQQVKSLEKKTED